MKHIFVELINANIGTNVTLFKDKIRKQRDTMQKVNGKENLFLLTRCSCKPWK